MLLTRELRSCGFPADGAVVLAVFPDADAGPWLRLNEVLESSSGEDAGLGQFFGLRARTAEAFRDPHQDERQRSAQRRCRLGDEADAARAERGEDRVESKGGLREDEKQPRSDHGVDLAGRLR